MKRIYNFSAGPSVLPQPVLDSVAANIHSYGNSGIGVMELSHRGEFFEKILFDAIAAIKELVALPQGYSVIFVPGGATTQFAMIPMCFTQGFQTADYVLTGAWAEKAAEEAAKFTSVHIAANSVDRNHSYIPTSVALSRNPAYVHFTSNNTIFGTQFQQEPEVGSALLVCDASSDFLHRPIDISKYSLIYAGAQKNLGAAGVAIVILKDELLLRIPKGLPLMLDYKTFVEHNSLYNTPPTFSIFVVGEVLKWIQSIGGLKEIERRNKEKAGILYAALESSDFYEPHAETNCRSLMNVTFRLKNPTLDKPFLAEAAKRGFDGLKGHRNVGGIRASIYNAFPIEGVRALVEFMNEFEKQHG